MPGAQGGMGDALWVSGVDISGDVGSLARVGGGPNPGEVTGINSSAMERIGLLRDGGIDFTSWWNPSAGGVHQTLKTLPYADIPATYCRGTVIGSHAASLLAKQVNYDGTRGQDGSLTHTTNAVGDGFGIEWGNLLTAGKRTDVAATNGAGVDLGAAPVSYSFGLVAYLHVFAFTGTSVTVAVQDSADNATFATIATFAAATAVGAQRVTTAIPTTTVRRYLRAITTGTFSNAVFGVSATRFETAQP